MLQKEKGILLGTKNSKAILLNNGIRNNVGNKKRKIKEMRI